MRSLSLTYRDRHRIETHVHPWAQLVYASSGLMRVTTPATAWLVPTSQAIWVPAGEPHAIEMRGMTAMRTLYVAPERAAVLPVGARALDIAPLLRELILHIVGQDMLDPRDPAQDRLAGLLIDLLQATPASSLSLPMPIDRRARRLADHLLDHPAEHRPLQSLALASGAGLRTLQRIFPCETGMRLEAWRIRARLQHGIVLLNKGASVSESAIEAGYSSPSAFIHAFRCAFGETPARYRRRRGAFNR